MNTRFAGCARSTGLAEPFAARAQAHCGAGAGHPVKRWTADPSRPMSSCLAYRGQRVPSRRHRRPLGTSARPRATAAPARALVVRAAVTEAARHRRRSRRPTRAGTILPRLRRRGRVSRQPAGGRDCGRDHVGRARGSGLLRRARRQTAALRLRALQRKIGAAVDFCLCPATICWTTTDDRRPYAAEGTARRESHPGGARPRSCHSADLAASRPAFLAVLDAANPAGGLIRTRSSPL